MYMYDCSEALGDANQYLFSRVSVLFEIFQLPCEEFNVNIYISFCLYLSINAKGTIKIAAWQ